MASFFSSLHDTIVSGAQSDFKSGAFRAYITTSTSIEQALTILFESPLLSVDEKKSVASFATHFYTLRKRFPDSAEPSADEIKSIGMDIEALPALFATDEQKRKDGGKSNEERDRKAQDTRMTWEKTAMGPLYRKGEKKVLEGDDSCCDTDLSEEVTKKAMGAAEVDDSTCDIDKDSKKIAKKGKSDDFGFGAGFKKNLRGAFL